MAFRNELVNIKKLTAIEKDITDKVQTYIENHLDENFDDKSKENILTKLDYSLLKLWLQTAK